MIMIMLLIKYIHMHKTHMKKNINYWLKSEKVGLDCYEPKAFIEYSNGVHDFYENIE